MNPLHRSERSRRRRLFLEALDPRLCLAGNVQVIEVVGHLFITGDNASNQVEVFQETIQQGNRSIPKVSIQGLEGTKINGSAAKLSYTLPASGTVGSLRLLMSGGNDQVVLRDLSVALGTYIWTGSGDDTIVALGDNSRHSFFTAFLEAGNDNLQMNGLDIDYSIYVDGGSDANTMSLVDTRVSGSATLLGNSGIDRYGLLAVEVTQAITINSGEGDDLIYMDHTEAQLGLTLLTGGGNDSVWTKDVTAQFQTFISTAGGNDFVNVDDSHFAGVSSVFLGTGNDDLAWNRSTTGLLSTAIGESGTNRLQLGPMVAGVRPYLHGFATRTIANYTALITTLAEKVAAAGFLGSQVDTDGDSLFDFFEKYLHHTNPLKFDTDGDLLSDGFEVGVVGLNPLVVDDIHADLDGDMLSNLEEARFGTRPDRFDTDGDTAGDGTEAHQGSDPKDASDLGVAPPPEDLIDVILTVGDPSGSHSERYDLVVGGITHQATQFGVVESATYKFRKGKTYPVQIVHRGSNLSEPDYDYLASITASSGGPQYLLEDLQGIMGNHSESTFFFAAGKTAQLHVPKISILEVSFIETIGDVLADANGTPFAKPHWTTGSTQGEPVAFARNTTPKISTQIQIEPSVLVQRSMIHVSAQGTQSLNVPETVATPSGNRVQITNVAIGKPLANTINRLDWELDWQVSFTIPNQPVLELDAGVTMNRTYVTLGAPAPSTGLFETVLDIGTRSTIGVTTETAAVAGIWSDFQSPATGVERADGVSMGYWTGLPNVPPEEGGTCQDLSGMIQTAHGSCLSWSDLFGSVLAAQGISNVELFEIRVNTTIIPGAPNNSQFLVKNWQFNGPGSNTGSVFPYQIGTDVLVLNRVSAQNNPASPAYFFNHYVVKWNGVIYDPSYGAGPFVSENDHENAASDGIGLVATDSLGVISGFARKNDPLVQELLYLPRGRFS